MRRGECVRRECVCVGVRVREGGHVRGEVHEAAGM